MTIDIVKRLRELGDWEVGDVKSDAIYHAAADEIERLNTMMSQWLAEDTVQFYGLYDTLNEHKEVIKDFCNHIEYLGYFIDEDFQSNDPNYEHAHFVLTFNYIRKWSQDLKKGLA